jgi:hypothetical protein
MPPQKCDRYLNAEFLGEAISHKSSHGMLAMHYDKDTLPSFLGVFIYTEKTESAVLVDINTGEHTSATAAGGGGKGVAAFSGRWIVMDLDMVGSCFKSGAGGYRHKLCVVIAPRYFLKSADESSKFGQPLASIKSKRPHPHSDPDAYIYTSDVEFKKKSYRFDEYNDDELFVVTADNLRSMLKKQAIQAYAGPYETLSQYPSPPLQC